MVRIRVRSATAGVAWTDSAILLCIVSLPARWVAPVVLAGVLLGKLLGHVRPYRALYNASKDALSATAGLLVAMMVGLPHAAEEAIAQPHLLILVAFTITVVEFAVGVPVIALAAKTPWYRVHRDDADIKAAFFAGKLLVTILTLLLFADNPRLLALVPLAALCLHMLIAGRSRARSDRVAWQRLARSTEQLGGADLDTVLTAAAGDAVALFAAEQAEVYVRDGPRGPWLARGDAHGVIWSGNANQAPPQALSRSTLTVSAPMMGDDGHIGEVRLHYEDTVSLSDRELLTLRTFASAVRAAARNASALAVADEMARDARRVDPLTGLANRTGLQEHGERLLAVPGLVALVTLDLDRVRQVNESLGHAAGDRVLVEVARRLSTVAGPDDLVARLHGDVFAVMLGSVTSLREAWDRASALLASLAPPLDAGGVRVRVEATAGVALRPADTPPVAMPAASALSMTELLRRADVAVRQAKRGGPRVVCYEPAHDPADVDALILGGELPRAIARREFTVCFQPIVDLDTGVMIGAEALARWRHPSRGELDPRRFLHAVERSGLLASFDEAVLDQALSAQARWRSVGISAPVSVNAAPRSVLDPEYPQRVHRALHRHGVAGPDLVIELTESLTLEDLELAEPILAQLRAAGVQLALDDFGTRSSPLAMVTRLPVVDLKIDRSFVESMVTSSEALAVVKSTVELGRSLGRTVVAEGVEREDQRRALVAMGCSAGQGHLFARAIPIDDLMQLVSPGLDGVVGRLARPLGPRPNGQVPTDQTEPDRGHPAEM